ncbi:MAG: type II toxin-antitoxin system VapC family toxin [Acidobacteriota bacterium]
MILLDTNVVSEPLKPSPDPLVIEWLDAQSIETLYISTTTLAEWLTGIRRMPSGKRRDLFEQAVEQWIESFIASRILPFDEKAAQRHADLSAQAFAIGKPVGFADCQIAAIASIHKLAVATRDEEPFRNLNIPVINPFQP